MKSFGWLLPVLLSATTMSNPVVAQEKKELKKVLELKIEGEGGANGIAVAWNPVAKLYYAAIAGNKDFPLEVFDAKGNPVPKGQMLTGADLRGLWYNPVTKRLEGNTYDEGGWVSYKLDAKGMPQMPDTLLQGLHQPDAQSAGNFEPKSGLVYFLNGATVYIYDAKKGEEQKQIDLFADLDMAEAEEAILAYNENVVLPTGVKGKEMMLINVESRTVDTYDMAGKRVAQAAIPGEDELNTFFNFSYTNGMIWVFNKDTRVWTAYK